MLRFSALQTLGAVMLSHPLGAYGYNHAGQAACGQAVDILFLQDTTQTFYADLPIVLRQLPEIYSSVYEMFPGSRFGVAEFKDKPFYPLGYPGHDYCYRLVSQTLTTDLISLMEDYGELFVSAGGDLPEASYQALINACYDNRVGWREFAGPEIDVTKTAARIIVLITDASPHFEGDMAKYPNDVPQLPKNPGGIWQDDFDGFCATYDYPHFNQVVEAINDQQVAVIFLVRNDAQNSFAAWSWFNSYLGQPADMIQPLSDDPSEFTEALIRVLTYIGNDQCVTTTTTTTTTTTPTTTTTTTTTTPTTTTTTPTTTTTTPTTTTATTTTTTTTTTPTTTTSTTTTTEPTTTELTTTETTTPPTTTTTPTTPTTTTSTTTTKPTTTTTVTDPAAWESSPHASSTEGTAAPVGTDEQVTRPPTPQTTTVGGGDADGDATTKKHCRHKERCSNDLIINIPQGNKEFALNLNAVHGLEWENVRLAHPDAAL